MVANDRNIASFGTISALRRQELSVNF